MKSYRLPERVLANAISQTNPVCPLFPAIPAASSISISGSALQEAILESFGKLAENWDGYDALTIKDATINNAKEILNSLNVSMSVTRPTITPHPNGLITFEWESMLGEAYLEVGLSRCCFYLSPSKGESIFWDGLVRRAPIQNIFSAIQAKLFPQFSLTTLTGPAMNLRYGTT